MSARRPPIAAAVTRCILPLAVLFGHTPPVNASPALPEPEFRLGSLHQGNYVWCVAMNLAWNELNESVLHGKLRLDTRQARALEMVDVLNRSPFGRRDLDEASCYVAGGYGQGTVERINREVRARFPGKSLQDLALTLKDRDIIAYAYFLKQVEYPVEFAAQPVAFNTALVDGFVARSRDQRENVRVVHYGNDERFVVSLRLKEPGDELLLAKGFDMRGPGEVVAAVNARDPGRAPAMSEDDTFAAPSLHLDHARSYDELVGNERSGPFLANEGFSEYYIAKMVERIRFDLDQRGARAEAEAAIAVAARAVPKKARRLVLDRPFWVVLRRRGSPNPYLLLGVNTADLMKLSGADPGR